MNAKQMREQLVRAAGPLTTATANVQTGEGDEPIEHHHLVAAVQSLCLVVNVLYAAVLEQAYDRERAERGVAA